MGIKCQRLGLILSALIFLFGTAKAENQTYPTSNNNLYPLEAWRSTEFCLQNVSKDTCGLQYTLNDSGWLNVTQQDGHDFCTGGCAEHTAKYVLVCLYEVMKDYRFVNQATIKDINDTINDGCNSPQGFTGVSKVSHGYRISSTPIITALAVIALLLTF